jgi:hypothetical protein
MEWDGEVKDAIVEAKRTLGIEDCCAEPVVFLLCHYKARIGGKCDKMVEVRP